MQSERHLDDELETAIDAVGRDKLFQIMREAGWGMYPSAPKWVWWMMIDHVREASNAE